MSTNNIKWEVLYKKGRSSSTGINGIIDILLENRGLKTGKKKEEFFKPIHPEKISVKSLSLSEKRISKAIERIGKAIKNSEEIIIYGDYDADGICATAILWETLYSFTKKVKPYIPNRFEEGYGINAKSIETIKLRNPNVKLIITVDNGIVANDAVDAAKKLGIDVIITDHHQPGKKLPNAFSIIHTDKISGSGVAWIFAREILKSFQSPISSRRLVSNSKINNLEISMENGKWKMENAKGLDLCAIGTIADQLPLIGPNRSFAKYGLESLNDTKRLGLFAMFEEAGIKRVSVTTYDVNYIIAPRINAMGRMEHAIDSLRLLCTKNIKKARELAQFLGKTNKERQRVVDEVVLHARELAQKTTWKGAIVLAHEGYHEGVIGLAASKLVDEFYRPAIVLSKGEKISKASARSVTGFNIIETIRKLDSITLGGGGHPMAAGFSIETDKIEIFSQKFEEITSPLLTDEILTKKLKIDTELSFVSINDRLVDSLEKFEPTGIGNPKPSFQTKLVSVVEARLVGQMGKHLKLKLENNGKTFDAIAFGMGEYTSELTPPGKKVDIVYNLSKEIWNGRKYLQLKIKDLRLKKKYN